MDDVLNSANAWADDSELGEDQRHHSITSKFNYINEKTLHKIGQEIGDKLAETFTQKQIDGFIYQLLEGAKKCYEAKEADMLVEEQIGAIFNDNVDINEMKERSKRILNGLSSEKTAKIKEKTKPTKTEKRSESIFEDVDMSNLL